MKQDLHLIHIGAIYKDKNDRKFILIRMWHGSKEWSELYSAGDDKIVVIETKSLALYLESKAFEYYSPTTQYLTK